MKNLLNKAKEFTQKHKKTISISGVVVAGVALIVAAIILIIDLTSTKVVYQPANACDLFTKAEADELFGVTSISAVSQEPVLTGDFAVSRCGYTDGKLDLGKMIVAAVTLRSGVNDSGVEKNTSEFNQRSSEDDAEPVDGLGEKAFYVESLGQLNVLSGYNWFILSNGIGDVPQFNTLEDSVDLAKKVLEN